MIIKGLPSLFVGSSVLLKMTEEFDEETDKQWVFQNNPSDLLVESGLKRDFTGGKGRRLLQLPGQKEETREKRKKPGQF